MHRDKDKILFSEDERGYAPQLIGIDIPLADALVFAERLIRESERMQDRAADSFGTALNTERGNSYVINQRACGLYNLAIRIGNLGLGLEPDDNPPAL